MIWKSKNGDNIDLGPILVEFREISTWKMECEISQKGPLLRISDLLGFDHTYMRVILPYAPVPGQISATILVKARCVKGKLSKKKAEQKVKTAFRVGGYLTFFTFLKHSNKVKKFQEGGV